MLLQYAVVVDGSGDGRGKWLLLLLRDEDDSALLVVILLLFDDLELIVKATSIGSVVVVKLEVEEFSKANLNWTPGGWFLMKFMSL